SSATTRRRGRSCWPCCGSASRMDNVPLFCLRLAAGMAASLLLLAPGSLHKGKPLVSPRFYRTHFLILFALACGSLLFLRSSPWPPLASVGAAVAASLLGYLSWSLEGAPGGRTLIFLTLASFLTGLGFLEIAPSEQPLASALGGLTSAGLLG